MGFMPTGTAYRTDAGHRTIPKALHRARQCLLALQKPDGHWCGELQGDTILESEYILLMAFLGREQEQRSQQSGPLYPLAATARRRLEQLSRRAATQRLVKAYFALKAGRP